ncbi:MAG: sugar nucleotide-binding protein, partial [Bacteroidales bacterium]|nr:sugar nucleotide-binding protein [Bacteroidales bacterium]
MKILVTGGLGQLGNSLKKISKDYDFEFVFTDLEELDITNEKQVEDFLSCDDFSFVINTAAYTAVD